MSVLFLHDVTPGSEEEREILQYLRSRSEKVTFPDGLLESVDWDGVIVTQPTPNGLLPLSQKAVSIPQSNAQTQESSVSVSQFATPRQEPAAVPPLNPSSSTLSADAPVFVPSWLAASGSNGAHQPPARAHPVSSISHHTTSGQVNQVSAPHVRPGTVSHQSQLPINISGQALMTQQLSQTAAYSNMAAPMATNRSPNRVQSPPRPRVLQRTTGVTATTTTPFTTSTPTVAATTTPAALTATPTATTAPVITTKPPAGPPNLQFGDVNLDNIIKDRGAAAVSSRDGQLVARKVADVNKDASNTEHRPNPLPVQVSRVTNNSSPPNTPATDPETTDVPSLQSPDKGVLVTAATTTKSPVSSRPVDAPTPKYPPVVQATPVDSVEASALSENGRASSALENSSAPSEHCATSAVDQKSPVVSKVAGSWASLFNKGEGPSVALRSDAVPQQLTTDTAVAASVVTAEKPTSNELGALLAEMKMSQAVVAIQPKRLINRANWCYINATLQALLACPPFYHMLKGLPAFPPLTARRSVTPVLDAMVQFVNEFSSVADRRRGKGEMKVDKPLEPTGIYDVLPKMKSAENTFQRGRQEDAEEFLTCLLNTLHEEILEAIKQTKIQSKDGLVNGHTTPNPDSRGDDAEDDDDGSDWRQVGPKNKSVVTHSSHVDGRTVTLISSIFGGCLRSSLSTDNSESATLEPFFTVPLNVQKARSIEEALHAFVCKEYIEGYTCPTTKQQLDAHRRLTFNQLPTILILHLKCFVYDKHGGSQKVNHTMEFSENLFFDKELLSPLAQKSLSKNERSYKLFAVVYHYGEKTTGGHYHTDAFHTGERCWVRFDDDSVKKITLQQVFEKKQSCVPYLLYYKRLDRILSTTSITTAHAAAK